MGFSQELHERLAPLRARLEAGAYEDFMRGEVTLDEYKEYLCQTYHFAKHVPRFFGLATSRIPADRLREARWFYEHGEGEIGHHLWALSDLRALGVDREEAERHAPNPGTYALVAASYYEAGHGNPLAVMGSSWAIEGLICDRYGAFADNLKARLGLADRALTFIIGHARADQEHAPENARFLDQIASDPADQAAIADFAARTLIYFHDYWEGIRRDAAGGFGASVAAGAAGAYGMPGVPAAAAAAAAVPAGAGPST